MGCGASVPAQEPAEGKPTAAPVTAADKELDDAAALIQAAAVSSSPALEVAAPAAAAPAATPAPAPAAAAPAAAQAEAVPAAAPAMQSAFVFTKPHANTEAVRELVSAKFAAMGITVVVEGDMDGPTIDSNKHIDQHYYAIASKATLLKPSELNVPKEKFSAQFEEEWDAVLEAGRVVNAMDALEKFGVDVPTLNTHWVEAQDAKKIVKLGGGFYCALVTVGEQEPLYVLNAFFMTMRSKFTSAEAKIHYYVVEFDPAVLPWADFRGKVLGPTDPGAAPADSLRGTLHTDWEKLGMAAAPNTSDNGVHASASPFEGLAERMNWLGRSVADDAFGKKLLDAGISEEMIKAWSVDPQVSLGDDKKGSIFDQLEDKDLEDCAAKAVELSKLQ